MNEWGDGAALVGANIHTTRWACIHACMNTWTCACTHMHALTGICMYPCNNRHMHVPMHSQAHVYMYRCTHIHDVPIHWQAHVCTHAFTATHAALTGAHIYRCTHTRVHAYSFACMIAWHEVELDAILHKLQHTALDLIS